MWKIIFLIALTCSPAHAAPQTNDPAQTHLTSAYDALKTNQTSDAIREFNAVLASDPSNVEANANLGVISFLAGDCAHAEPPLRAALKVEPNLVKAQAILGICAKRLGEPGAQQLLQAAFTSLEEPNLRIQVGVELADFYYQRGELDHVLPVLQALVDLSPDNTDILFFAQRVYQAMADNTLDKLAVLAPGSARMQQLIAERLINAGNLKDAIAHYRAALKLDPRLPGMHFELSEALLESTPMDPRAQAEAEAELQAAIATSGDNAAIEAEMGEIEANRSNFPGAQAHYTRALALNPSSVPALMGLARLEMQAGQPEQAAAHLEQAAALEPLNAQAHYRLALAYRTLHQSEKSQQQLKLFQDIKQTRDRVAALYREMGKPQTPAETQP